MPLSTALTLGILAHLAGDYVLQSDWMAQRKIHPRISGGNYSLTEAWAAAGAHGALYTLPFTAITLDWRALLVIGVTHILLDHYRAARWIVWAKNYLAPAPARPEGTGDHSHSQPWLVIVTDNTVHLVINSGALALTWTAA